MKRKFIVIGMDDNREIHFPDEVWREIRRGRLFSGGLRHREIMMKHLPEGAVWVPITVPLEDVFTQYELLFSQQKEAIIIVFASGDPLFFGFANTIRRKLPDAEITVYPAFNSLQTLAHRLVMPYDDMRTVSLTGRPWDELDRALIERTAKIGILTDRTHTPATIAARMLEYGYSNYTLYIGELLGNPEKERIRRMSLEEATRETFQHPNNLIAVQDEAPSCIPSHRPFGIPDEDFELLNGRARMLTKAPIRLLTLQALGLNGRSVFWDIGFCTGSVSIEARLQFPHLKVVSFEIRPEGEALMQTNSKRFGAPGITMLIGDFLKADLSTLPRPDAVFIGGHGGELKQMLQRIKQHITPDGTVVFNSVSAESKELFIQGAKEAGFRYESSHRIALDDYNPIEIMRISNQPSHT